MDIAARAKRFILVISLVSLCLVFSLMISDSFSYESVTGGVRTVRTAFLLSVGQRSKFVISGSNGFVSESDLIVHYVRYYDSLYPNKDTDSLKLLDCLGIYSVILNLKPTVIYVHTNVPSFWPFDRCESLMNVTIRWPAVEFIYAARKFVASGKRIGWIQHEADIRKMIVIEEYGGLTLDFDVYIVNGTEVRRLLAENPCIVCHEGAVINAGFFGCREPHARFPQLVLKKSYLRNYDPKCWTCNSGAIPMKILKQNTATAMLVDNVCNAPIWDQRADFNDGRGVFGWKEKPAYHSFFHNSTFSLKDAMKLDSRLGDVFRWILKGGPPGLLGAIN
ncbi:hypothetical protein RvY_03150 [Ramazzottius varieornatus]|uniref:Alpha-1,4-N-acetylglucosaminyltransferase n=1 Tax=Ramazzottius varieornatus TaxID=947166 RepID=A0A1D1UM22_RAMVA|nr:hypothetical protein RvY_03150 [Ramazzottius varieornatus]